MKIPNETRYREKFLLLLKGLRQEKAIRQIDIAEQLGVPQSFVSKYESGERRLDILELMRICQLMGITLHEFAKKLEEVLNETK
jgi:transcriptional regulator with XRE-family HTH domain